MVNRGGSMNSPTRGADLPDRGGGQTSDEGGGVLRCTNRGDILVLYVFFCNVMQGQNILT